MQSSRCNWCQRKSYVYSKPCLSKRRPRSASHSFSVRHVTTFSISEQARSCLALSFREKLCLHSRQLLRRWSKWIPQLRACLKSFMSLLDNSTLTFGEKIQISSARFKSWSLVKNSIFISRYEELCKAINAEQCDFSRWVLSFFSVSAAQKLP